MSLSNGFTLIETLVAVLLLATAIAGPLTLASKGLTAALVAKDQITAYFLAQDAVEYVRYKRDSACLALAPAACDNTWLSSLAACTSADGCYLDATENSPAAPTMCPSGGCIPASGSNVSLCYDEDTHRYGYGIDPSTCPVGTTKSVFARQISITTPIGSNADEALLMVTVVWSDLAGIVHRVVTHESLLNWQ